MWSRSPARPQAAIGSKPTSSTCSSLARDNMEQWRPTISCKSTKCPHTVTGTDRNYSSSTAYSWFRVKDMREAAQIYGLEWTGNFACLASHSSLFPQKGENFRKGVAMTLSAYECSNLRSWFVELRRCSLSWNIWSVGLCISRQKPCGFGSPYSPWAYWI